jgi:plastocyanin
LKEEFMHRRAIAVLAVIVLAACGGGGGGGSTGGPTAPNTPPVDTPFVITITSAGVVSPREIRVPLGAQVNFVNNDSRSHQMTSDPHPTHTDCPPVTVGIVAPGQTRSTGVLNVARTCGYHDHDRDFDDDLRGRIVVGQ